MKISIYTLTHKAFEVPPDPMYVPLQVGSALGEDLGCLRDDTGDNISARNIYYSELTGFYWIWKNDRTSDYIGTCHYRRYLINSQEKILTRGEYEALFREYDLVTTKLEVLNNSYRDGFAANHNVRVLDAVGEVIRERDPVSYGVYRELVNGPETYYCNMLVTSRELFAEYAEWLFGIFGQVEKRVDLDAPWEQSRPTAGHAPVGSTEYHKRVFGFISEFLLTVWVRMKKLRVYECKVGVLGEKAETGEVKRQLAEYIRRLDIDGAKEYFLGVHRRRPDIMMEAADVTGELHLAMQVIATADAERKRTGHSFLEKERELAGWYPFFSRLNRIVSAAACGTAGREELDALQEFSAEAIAIAVAILPKEGIDRRRLTDQLVSGTSFAK